jgi:hypothetical protein
MKYNLLCPISQCCQYLDYTGGSNGRMTDEWYMIWKEAVVVYKGTILTFAHWH